MNVKFIQSKQFFHMEIFSILFSSQNLKNEISNVFSSIWFYPIWAAINNLYTVKSDQAQIKIIPFYFTTESIRIVIIQMHSLGANELSLCRRLNWHTNILKLTQLIFKHDFPIYWRDLKSKRWLRNKCNAWLSQLTCIKLDRLKIMPLLYWREEYEPKYLFFFLIGIVDLVISTFCRMPTAIQ